MLAAKKLPQILESELKEGLEGIVLLTVEGSILCSSFTKTAKVDEISLAAISTSVWAQYSNGKKGKISFTSSLISIYRL